MPYIQKAKADSFPRTSGGVSNVDVTVYQFLQFSPHQRGCFLLLLSTQGMVQVFPAPAGVFLILRWFARNTVGFPRTSGGVSLLGSVAVLCLLFSPHQRGCFLAAVAVHRVEGVFPAPAGVFLIA